MNETVRKLEEEMRYAVSERKANEFSALLAEFIFSHHQKFSPGETLAGMAVVLGRLTAITSDNHDSINWYESILVLFRESYQHQMLRKQRKE